MSWLSVVKEGNGDTEDWRAAQCPSSIPSKPRSFLCLGKKIFYLSNGSVMDKELLGPV